MHAAAFEVQRELAKIGKPVDRAEWDMTPPTVNAYYDPRLNEMVFPGGHPPAAVLRRSRARSRVNIGAIGMVMGHELTHGFDDEGRQFDGDGQPERLVDRRRSPPSFDKRAACVARPVRRLRRASTTCT